MKNFLNYWGPPILLMLIIFYLSSRQSVSVAEDFSTNFLFFKSIHIGEFALLSGLLFRAFYKTTELSLKKVFFASFAFALLYAVSDETHQTFVPTRNGQIFDIFVDLIGIVAMLIFIKVNLKWIKSFL